MGDLQDYKEIKKVDQSGTRSSKLYEKKHIKAVAIQSKAESSFYLDQEKATMKFQITIILFTAALAYASNYKQTPLTIVHHAPAVQSANAYGAGHSAYGHLNKASGAHGYGAYGDRAAYGAYAHGDAGVKANAASRDLRANSAVGAAHSNYKDKGLYSRNRGYGYQKAYGYDKEISAHDIGANSGAYGSKFGLSDKYGHSNLDAHNRYAHGAHAGHDRYGAHGYGRYGHLNSGYGQAGYAHGANAYAKQPAPTYVVAHPAPAVTYSHGGPYSKITYH
ncbi:uncharacterized protein LOC106478006 [Limulus polyphemus]|uniref:Uncharacterized protein LOC106478006 n=1 Tax=Limulus polyphemus TaxID=6850 RepID=A0ABM1C4G7_LIMPO|nr:uncharacterized protein LOC106478006 [Limulus polyphemus]